MQTKEQTIRKPLMDSGAAPGQLLRRPLVLVAVVLASMALTTSGTAMAGLILVSPAGGTLDFGQVLVGKSPAGTVTVENTDAAKRSITFGPSTGSPPFGQQGATTRNNVASNANASSAYTFTPTARGVSNGSATVTSSGGNSVNVQLTGQGVAPVNSVSTDNAGRVRIGTTGNAHAIVTNIGDGNLSGLSAAQSNLRGSLAATAAPFDLVGAGNINLADAASKTFDFKYTPTAHTIDSADVTASFLNGNSDGTNSAETVLATVTGRGVGPEYTSITPPGSTLDFGNVRPSDTGMYVLKVSNSTLDPGREALTGLTLLSLSFSNPLFSAPNFSPGSVLDAGDVLLITLEYQGSGNPGSNTGTLTISTDQGAGFQDLGGDSFLYDLKAIQSSPEPSTLILGGLGLVGGLIAYRRSQS